MLYPWPMKIGHGIVIYWEIVFQLFSIIFQDLILE